MTADEQSLATAARLYEARRTARDIRGVQYAADMVVFKKAIRDFAKQNNLDLLPATLELGKRAQAKDGELLFMLFMAAFVELTEEV
ncbi:MAG TPA: hypothetical protein VL997_03360 [Dyella sp.]|nr:hypothetical protein [Dyella sp.]